VSAFVSAIGVSIDQKSLIFLGFLIILFLAVAAMFRFATNWGIELFSLRFSNSLTQSVLSRTVRAPYYWLKRQNMHALSLRISLDAVSVGQTIYPGALEILYSLAIMSIGLAVIVISAPQEALIAILGISVLASAVFVYLNPRVARQATEFRDRGLDANRLAIETFAIHKTLKVTVSEEYFIRRFYRAFRAMNRARMQMSLTNKALPTITLLLGQVGLISIAIAMLYSGMSAEVLVAQLTLITVVVARILPTASGLTGSLNKLTKTLPHYRGLLAHLVELERLEAGAGHPSTVPLPKWNSLTLDDVTYIHPDSDKPQIRDLTLEIHRGGRYAVVGHTGAGKSTLVDLLLGLIEPTEGQVRLDGANIVEFDRTKWLASIGYVAQETLIVDDTVRRNVAFGIDDEKIDDAKVLRAISMAGLAPEIAGLPNGLSERVGEAGSRLSGGQRQRLAIARALYREVEILLLDEATSGLDPATEAEVLQNLVDLPHGVTLIMITHRLATTSFCDHVFVLSDGALASEAEFERLGSGVVSAGRVDTAGSRSG